MTSNYFSGFCLKDEKELFSSYLIENDFTLQGFSYGCIEAFSKALVSEKRIDLLQLFSPAFFQSKNKKFHRLQLMYYKKNKKSYVLNFIKNIASPSSYDCSSYIKEGTYEELETLLSYEWKKENLEKLLGKGTKIEVYLGEKDEIIQSKETMDFFKEYASVYYIKNAGHILKT